MAFQKRSKSHGAPCSYCKRIMHVGHEKLDPTRDHLIPQSRDGRIIVICCVQCNTIKADMGPEQWDAFMLAHPKWWERSKSELRVMRRAPIDPSPHSLHELVQKFRGRPMRNTHRKGQKVVVVPPELLFPEAASKFDKVIEEFRVAVAELWPVNRTQ